MTGPQPPAPKNRIQKFEPSFRFLPSGKEGSRRPTAVYSDPLLLLTSGVKSDRFQSCRSGFGPASGAGDPEDLKRPTESDRTKVGMSGNPTGRPTTMNSKKTSSGRLDFGSKASRTLPEIVRSRSGFDQSPEECIWC